MTLLEMSVQYADSAALIRARIRELRAEERQQADPEAARGLRRRIDELTPLLRECRELADVYVPFQSLDIVIGIIKFRHIC